MVPIKGKTGMTRRKKKKEQLRKGRKKGKKNYYPRFCKFFLSLLSELFWGF